MEYSRVQFTDGCHPETSMPWMPEGCQALPSTLSDMAPMGPEVDDAEAVSSGSGRSPPSISSMVSSESSERCLASSTVFWYWPMVAPGVSSPVLGADCGSSGAS